MNPKSIITMCAAATLLSSTGCSQHVNTTADTSVVHTAAKPGNAHSSSTQPTKDPYEGILRLKSISNLMHSPTTVNEFMLHDKLGAAVTGRVLSTKVEVSPPPGLVTSTYTEFQVLKSSKPEDFAPNDVITVKFAGGLTTKGALHEEFDVKEDKNGVPLSTPVKPDDLTPVLVEHDGSPPPVVGDEMLVFLTSDMVPAGAKYVYPLSLHRGTYTKDRSAKPQRSDAGTVFSRNFQPAIDPGDGHLKTLTIQQLNDVITQLRANRSTNPSFDHKPL